MNWILGALSDHCRGKKFFCFNLYPNGVCRGSSAPPPSVCYYLNQQSLQKSWILTVYITALHCRRSLVTVAKWYMINTSMRCSIATKVCFWGQWPSVIELCGHSVTIWTHLLDCFTQQWGCKSRKLELHAYTSQRIQVHSSFHCSLCQRHGALLSEWTTPKH